MVFVLIYVLMYSPLAMYNVGITNPSEHIVLASLEFILFSHYITPFDVIDDVHLSSVSLFVSNGDEIITS